MTTTPDATKPCRYFIAGCHGGDDGGPDGAEIRLTRDAVEDLLGWVRRFEGLGEDAVYLLVANPASTDVRWLAGVPAEGAPDDECGGLLDELDDDGVACNCGCAWDDAPWTWFASYAEPGEVHLQITRHYVRWIGYYERPRDGDVDSEETTQGIGHDELRKLRTTLIDRKES